jgi:1-acyl-sn-glycerol-3-phosphate acyltransferase
MGAEPGSGSRAGGTAVAHLSPADSGLRLGLFYALSLYLSRFAALFLLDLRVFGSDRVPARGPVIIAPNHQSVLDPWLTGLCLYRRGTYLARHSLFQVPILGWLIRQYDALPVEREKSAPRAGFEVCLRALEMGRALLLFPEGTRSYDGQLQPLKRGVALLARRGPAPVIPVWVAGTRGAWPRGRKLPRPGKVRLYFGSPLELAMDESSDSFMDRLRNAYRVLACEAGDGDLVPEESWAEGRGVPDGAVAAGAKATPLPTYSEEPARLLEAASDEPETAGAPPHNPGFAPSPPAASPRVTEAT